MTGWNLPPGCTDRMVDEAFGASEGRRGVYKVTIERTITATITVEVEAGSEEDANWDGARSPLRRFPSTNGQSTRTTSKRPMSKARPSAIPTTHATSSWTGRWIDEHRFREAHQRANQGNRLGGPQQPHNR